MVWLFKESDMHPAELIRLTQNYVKQTLEKDSSGHDWWHVYRVWRNALAIAKHESCNVLVVELAALLHDIADWKFHGGDSDKGPSVARDWLQSQQVDAATIEAVCEVIAKCSYKGAKVAADKLSIEGQIVQDADRLDALGAIGIARTFAYGGYKQRPMYDPTVPPVLHDSFEAYKTKQSHTINHFYEKLLLLKARMNTQTGKALAERRHRYMENFLQEFMMEWDGEIEAIAQ
jgi:uncharacterized protein